MILVRYRSPVDLSIEADAAGYQELATLLHRGAPEIVPLFVPKQETPAPYARFLKTLRLEPTNDKAAFRVAGSKLFLSGAANYWNDLGNNVDFLLRNYRSGTHLHIEYFPNHWFLDASSVPAVLELI